MQQDREDMGKDSCAHAHPLPKPSPASGGGSRPSSAPHADARAGVAGEGSCDGVATLSADPAAGLSPHPRQLFFDPLFDPAPFRAGPLPPANATVAVRFVS